LEVKSVEAAGDGALAGWRGDRRRGRGRGAAPVGGGAAPTTGGRGVGCPAGGSGTGDHRKLGSIGIGAEEEGRNLATRREARGSGDLESGGRGGDARERPNRPEGHGESAENGLEKFFFSFLDRLFLASLGVWTLVFFYLAPFTRP